MSRPTGSRREALKARLTLLTQRLWERCDRIPSAQRQRKIEALAAYQKARAKLLFL